VPRRPRVVGARPARTCTIMCETPTVNNKGSHDSWDLQQQMLHSPMPERIMPRITYLVKHVGWEPEEQGRGLLLSALVHF
jgi:hypothetical protein